MIIIIIKIIIGSLVFFDILHEVEGPQVFKTDRVKFFGTILENGPKMGQKRPKMAGFVCSSITTALFQDWLISFFYILHEIEGP